jgi:hypothetical protein
MKEKWIHLFMLKVAPRNERVRVFHHSFVSIYYSILWDPFLRIGICMKKNEGKLGVGLFFRQNSMKIFLLLISPHMSLRF